MADKDFIETDRGRDGKPDAKRDQQQHALTCDAMKRADAERVTMVMPYFSYAKGDKKDEPRVSIRARVCARRSTRSRR